MPPAYTALGGGGVRALPSCSRRQEQYQHSHLHAPLIKFAPQHLPFRVASGGDGVRAGQRRYRGAVAVTDRHDVARERGHLGGLRQERCALYNALREIGRGQVWSWVQSRCALDLLGYLGGPTRLSCKIWAPTFAFSGHMVYPRGGIQPV